MKTRILVSCERNGIRGGLWLLKWEYLVVPIKTRIHSGNLGNFEGGGKPVMDDVQNDLNTLGDEGWELVCVQDITLADGRMYTVAYLKRQTT